MADWPDVLACRRRRFGRMSGASRAVLSVLLQILAVIAILVAASQRRAPRRRRIAVVLAAVAMASSLLFAGDPHVLRKWLARLVMPMGWFLLIALAAACWLWWQERRREAIAATGALVLYALAGNVWLSHALLRGLEAGYRAPEAGDEPFDVVVLLGGGTGLDTEGRPQLTVSGDRVAMAARLHHLGLAPKILSTGSAIPALQGNDRGIGEDTRLLLTHMGVPADAVERLDGPKTTSEELRAVAARASEAGWRRVGLLTSAWHLPRATRLAARVGLEVTPIPCDYRSGETMVTIVHLLPNPEGFGNLTLYLWELLGMAMGR